jgi:hypothetical protein
MAKKVTIKSLQDEIKKQDKIIQNLFDNRFKLIESNGKLIKRNKSLEKQNEFVNEVKIDYILSNKHIRDMEAKRVEMEYEKNKLSTGIIGVVVNVAEVVLPGLLNSFINPEEKEVKTNTNSNQDGK